VPVSCLWERVDLSHASCTRGADISCGPSLSPTAFFYILGRHNGNHRSPSSTLASAFLYNLMRLLLLSSLTTISCYHLLLSSLATISYYHLLLPSLTIISYYHLLLTIISYYDLLLSSLTTISYLLSFLTMTSCYHILLPSLTIISYFHISY
jgi:hypothetical protein